jgi:hypothetical protein
MRKILLASTALVACGTVAAHAADVSINGTTDWHYISYDNDSNTGAQNGSQSTTIWTLTSNSQQQQTAACHSQWAQA